MSYFESNLFLINKVNPQIESFLADSTPYFFKENDDNYEVKSELIEGVIPKEFPKIQPDPNCKMVFLLGLGDGSYLREILKNKNHSHVLLYENDLRFLRTALNQFDFSDVFSDSRLRIVFGNGESFVFQQLHNYFFENTLRLTYVFHFGLLENNSVTFLQTKEKTNFFHKVLNAVISNAIKSIKSNLQDAYRGMGFTLKNTPEYYQYPQIHSLKNSFTNKPGIVVATGPSLKQTISLLKGNADKFVIFSCDSSLKILLENGIHPDFVGSIERLRDTEYLFEGMIELSNTYLFGPSVMSPIGLDAFKGPKLRFTWKNAIDNWFVEGEPTEVLGKAPSVGHLCYMGLRILGCDPIFLIGHDSAYDPKTGASHDKGAADFILQVELEQEELNGEPIEILDVVGYDGKTKRTTYYWSHFANHFGYVIQRYGGHVYNVMPEEYGIPVAKTHHLLPEQADEMFSSYEKVEKSEVLEKLKSHTVDDNLIQKGFQNLKHKYNLLKEIRDESLKTIRLIDEFWADHDARIEGKGYKEKYEHFFRTIDFIIEQLIQKDHGFLLIDFIGMSNSYINNRIQLEQVRYTVDHFPKKVYYMVEAYNKIFHDFFFWCSRVIDLMDELKKVKWKDDFKS